MSRPTPSTLRILPLGMGDAFSIDHGSTCMLLLGPETPLLVDCPDTLPAMLRRTAEIHALDLQIGRFDDLLLTHLHGDHCNGLESLLFYRKFVLGLPPLRIHSLPELEQPLWEQRLQAAMGRNLLAGKDGQDRFAPTDYYEFHPIRPREPREIQGIRIEVRHSLHSVPTFGFVAEAAGHGFAYSGDCIYEAEHLKFLGRAGLIFHDAGGGEIHCRHDQLLQAPEPLRERIHILHLSDRFDRASARFPIVETGRLYDAPPLPENHP